MTLLLNVAKSVPKSAFYKSLVRYPSSLADSGRKAEGEGPLVVVGSSRDLVHRVGTQVEVRTDFITEHEEAELLRDLEPGLKKKRYEFDHWDDVSPIS